MNTKDMLETLYRLFEDYTFHDLFLKELSCLLKKDLRGKENRFFNLMSTQFANIKSFGCNIYKVDGHEKLLGADGHYYSIHLQQSQFNIRFIVYIFDNGIPYFLCAFNEKSGKSYTNYSSYTSVMEQRLNDLLGDDIDD